MWSYTCGTTLNYITYMNYQCSTFDQYQILLNSEIKKAFIWKALTVTKLNLDHTAHFCLFISLCSVIYILWKHKNVSDLPHNYSLSALKCMTERIFTIICPQLVALVYLLTPLIYFQIYCCRVYTLQHKAPWGECCSDLELYKCIWIELKSKQQSISIKFPDVGQL